MCAMGEEYARRRTAVKRYRPSYRKFTSSRTSSDTANGLANDQ